MFANPRRSILAGRVVKVDSENWQCAAGRGRFWQTVAGPWQSVTGLWQMVSVH